MPYHGHQGRIWCSSWLSVPLTSSSAIPPLAFHPSAPLAFFLSLQHSTHLPIPRPFPFSVSLEHLSIRSSHGCLIVLVLAKCGEIFSVRYAVLWPSYFLYTKSISLCDRFTTCESNVKWSWVNPNLSALSPWCLFFKGNIAVWFVLFC